MATAFLVLDNNTRAVSLFTFSGRTVNFLILTQDIFCFDNILGSFSGRYVSFFSASKTSFSSL